MLVYALRNGDNVLHFDELKNTVGDEFAAVLWACIKHNQEHEHYYYSKTLDAIVVKTDDAENMSEAALLSTIDALLTTLPDVMLASEKESTIAELAEKNSIPKEALNSVFDSIYQQSENFLHRGRLTVVFMCEYVLKNRFQAGFKIADDFEADRFRQYMVELFGTCAKSITTRAIDADVGRLGVLCDRGKYIHPDYLVVDPSVIDTINDYIEASPRSLIPYGELFDALKEKFDGTQITNRFLLQGALKKYGCRFSTGRDFVRKTKSVTFVDELESFVSDRGIVHKSEIFAEFTSLGEAGLGQVVSRSAKAAIKNAREEIAKCINAKPSEIFFTSGGTESDNWAIKGCAFADESKRTTITSTIEHHAVLRSCQFIERLGYPVAYITPNSNGLITVEMLEQVIAGTTNLVSVATANNEIGTIQPIKKLAEIAHRNGAFFHTDAVQAIGHIPIDVNELNVDLLSASAHKFNGPKGIGFLYVREGTPILPLLNGGAQENSLRAGTENVASIVGMATALSMNCSQIQKSQNHSAKMVELICSILNDAEVDYIRNGYSNGLKGTLNLSFRGKDGEAILHRLDLRGILVSTGSACDSNSVQVSHVIKAINVPDSYAKGTIRISLGKDNTIEEAKIIGETLVSVLMEQK